MQKQFHDEAVKESGRSMVEMLSVLAVVGLLSIVGLYGYTKAMNRYHANELLNDVVKQAMLVAGQITNTGEVPGTLTDNENSSGHIYTVGDKGNNQFTLDISNVDNETCELMKQIAGGTIQDITCGDNGATFTFNNDLSTGEGAGTPQTHAYDNNQAGCEGAGYQYCANNTCITKEETCPQNTCETVLDCGEHGVWNNGTCQCDCNEGWYGPQCDSDCDGFRDEDGFCTFCSDEESPFASAEECDKCKNTQNPRFMSHYGECVPCSEQFGDLINTAEESDKCRNSQFPRFVSTASNALRSYLCSSEKDVKVKPGDDAACDNTPWPRFTQSSATIPTSYPCSYLKGVSASSDECARCDHSSTPREMKEGSCVLKNCSNEQFRNSYDNRCVSCSDPVGYTVSAEECAKCNNTDTPRKIFKYRGSDYCGLVNCPSGKQHDETGGCYQ